MAETIDAVQRDTTITMLQFEVKPQIKKAIECLKEGKIVEAYRILARDVVGLLDIYQKSESMKYDNVPDNLKNSPNAQRMQQNVVLYNRAIALLCDEEGMPREINEGTLLQVYEIVDSIIAS